MGVEGGGISVGGSSLSIGGGVGVSAGPAGGGGASIGGISAPSMEAGPAGGFGPSFVNEGPVGPGFLENTMPITLNNFKLLGEIIFNPVKGEEAPSIIGQAEEVAAAAWENPQPVSVVEQAVRPSLVVNSIVKAPEQPAVVSLPNPATGLDIRVIANPFGVAKVETAPQNIVSPSTEGVAVSRVARITSTPAQSYVPTEQIVEENKILVGREQQDKQSLRSGDLKPEAKKNETITALKVKLVEAVEISKNRVRGLREAYQKAKAEGLSPKWLRRFLGKEYWEQKSPIAENYDGTLDPTVKDVEVYADEIKGDQEAENAFAQAVSNHIPVEEGKDGRQATIEEVREVLEGKEKEDLRSNTPAAIVIKRVVAKNVEVTKAGQTATVAEERAEEAGETSLKDFPSLAEVFPKAS